MMTLYTVVPCFNEEECLDDTCEKLLNKYTDLMEKKLVSRESRIIFVDDGSSDGTWEIIRRHNLENHVFSGIKLSRNRGHQNAVYAGLADIYDKCDAVITIDADLQDDISVFDDMIEKYGSGYDIIYGVRKLRDSDTFFKRETAKFFYSFMKFLGSDLIYNHADYRLMSRRAIASLIEFKETSLFLRGTVPLIGYKNCCVYYNRKERLLGKSKYTLSKMFSLAINGIFSFSSRPVDLILFSGILITVISLLSYLILTVRLFINSPDITSWILTSVFFCTGLILSSLGIVGEYVCITMFESKHRPKYFIEDRIA